jgi:hypothetical protein
MQTENDTPKPEDSPEQVTGEGCQERLVRLLRCRWIGRYSKTEKLLRLIRIIWQRGDGPGLGGRGNYSAKLSVAVEFKLADFWIGAFWKTKRDEKWLWVCVIPCVPLRFHYQRSYGGRHV